MKLDHIILFVFAFSFFSLISTYKGLSQQCYDGVSQISQIHVTGLPKTNTWNLMEEWGRMDADEKQRGYKPFEVKWDEISLDPTSEKIIITADLAVPEEGVSLSVHYAKSDPKHPEHFNPVSKGTPQFNLTGGKCGWGGDLPLLGYGHFVDSPLINKHDYSVGNSIQIKLYIDVSNKVYCVEAVIGGSTYQSGVCRYDTDLTGCMLMYAKYIWKSVGSR